MRPFGYLIVAATFGIFAAAATEASPLPARTSDAGGVRVTVTPETIGGDTWRFKVVLDTHSKALDSDLVKDVVLIDKGGHRHTPQSWQGSPPGGHHREGILRFAASKALERPFEMRMKGVGGIAERVFRWNGQ
jgi:hypothetical protein